MPYPIVKVISCKGCRSYLVACPNTKKAALIDPKVGREATYHNLLAAYGVDLVAVIDTHTHADHLSTSPTLVQDGIDLFMSAKTEVARPMKKWKSGDTFLLGDLVFRILEVPGHTEDSIALYWAGTTGPGMVMCGDSLFIDGLARADFVGSDPAQLFDSVQAELMTLPDDTIVYPGHCYSDHLFTTIGHERKHNPSLCHPDGQAYARELGATPGAGNSPAVNATLATNLESHPKLPESAAPAAACGTSPTGAGAEKPIVEVSGPELGAVHADLFGPAHWVDVRDPFEYEHGHIPGVTSIPLGALGFSLPHFEGLAPVYVSCRSGVRSQTAIRTLRRLGVCEGTNVGGGILAWQNLGLAIEGQPAV